MKHKNIRILKKLAIAFVIVLAAIAVYVKIQPYTYEAKQRIELESKSKQLIETKQQLEKQSENSKEQQQKLDEINKQLEETKKQLEAKRNGQRAYAASLGANGNCVDWMNRAGIALTAATTKLIINESGCRTSAVNPKSGACGIPQALPCSKLPCALNDSGAICQLQWMDRYVKDRYGSWDHALQMWYSRCPTPEGCWY